MLSRAQNTFHHNPRLRGPVSYRKIKAVCYRLSPLSIDRVFIDWRVPVYLMFIQCRVP